MRCIIKKSASILIASLLILVTCTISFGQNISAEPVSAEARRYFNRGLAAVDLARSPADYDFAIEEFSKARSLAPDWPDVHYNLGIIQGKAGKFREAAASLKEYIRLAPNDPQSANIQSQIYQLEYKAEQVLTVAEIIDVLVSFRDQWAQEGKCSEVASELTFERAGHDAVKVRQSNRYYSEHPVTYQTLKITGPVVKYLTTINVCSPSAAKEFGNCDSVSEYEVEVASKRLVAIKQTVLRAFLPRSNVADGQRFACSFRKK